MLKELNDIKIRFEMDFESFFIFEFYFSFLIWRHPSCNITLIFLSTCIYYPMLSFCLMKSNFCSNFAISPHSNLQALKSYRIYLSLHCSLRSSPYSFYVFLLLRAPTALRTLAVGCAMESQSCGSDVPGRRTLTSRTAAVADSRHLGHSP
jgi:hypothetical protein